MARERWRGGKSLPSHAMLVLNCFVTHWRPRWAKGREPVRPALRRRPVRSAALGRSLLNLDRLYPAWNACFSLTVDNRALNLPSSCLPQGNVTSLAPPCLASAVMASLLALQLCLAGNTLLCNCALYVSLPQTEARRRFPRGRSQCCTLCPASPMNWTHTHTPRG